MTSAGSHDGSEDQSARAVAGLIDLVAGTLSVARALVQGERHIDLGGLDCEIGNLCARILDLPPQQGRGFRAPLVALLNELDALNAALEAP